VIDYEILLMLDPETPDERQQEIVTRTRELIERGGGRFDKHEVWGRRKLAYEIDHKPDGAYHLLTFAAEPAALDEVSRILKITDGVMRHLAVRRPKPGRTTTAAPPPREMARSDTDREPEYAAPAIESEERE
jgi:small subunit ribosomal protein S6